ncbi:MAG: hypothetical protein JWQ40_992 [Segetibacter sp.]|jgi:hypothetical protein|nr:hypothetical protein [Segetibacter sp.]
MAALVFYISFGKSSGANQKFKCTTQETLGPAPKPCKMNFCANIYSSSRMISSLQCDSTRLFLKPLRWFRMPSRGTQPVDVPYAITVVGSEYYNTNR